MRPRVIITDIEGTTTPIAFVRDVLFPFARERLDAFVEAHGDRVEVAEALAAAAALADVAPGDRAAILDALKRWIDADRKAAPLKILQGMIWDEGFRDGRLVAPVYPDAARALRAWHGEGVRLAVYSSGSQAAQQLLFGHSDQGDLRDLFSHWFDLETGPKLERDSYARIAATLGVGPSGLLFLSDHPGELEAAALAGLAVLRLDRGTPPPAPAGAHPVVRSFDDIHLDPEPDA